MPIRVQVGNRTIEFPDGTPQQEMLAALEQLPSEPMVSHGQEPARPVATGGGRGTGLDVRKSNQWASDNAPAIGATLATAATGGGALPMILAAGAGGAGGSLLRGDDLPTAATEGALQGGLQAIPAVLRKSAPALYRTVVPKAVQDKFSQVDLAAKGLQDRVLLGTKSGTARASAANARAGGQIADAADSVPPMTGRSVQEAFKPKYNKALTGGKIDRANEINAHVRKSMNEIGPGDFSGKQQLARKEFLEQEAKPAMQAANSNMASIDPQLANIERKAIAKNLRHSPQMERALNESQAAVGMSRAAQATQNSSLVNRLTSGGGIWNSLRSPAVISGTAIGMNELANIPFAQLVRMAQMAQLQDEE